LGFLWILWNAESHLQKILPKELEGKPITLIGTVDSIPIQEENSLKFEFRPEGLTKSEGIIDPEGINIQWKKPGKILLHWHHNKVNTPPKVGEKWKINVK
jgi:competence protein ComEC